MKRIAGFAALNDEDKSLVKQSISSPKLKRKIKSEELNVEAKKVKSEPTSKASQLKVAKIFNL